MCAVFLCSALRWLLIGLDLATLQPSPSEDIWDTREKVESSELHHIQFLSPEWFVSTQQFLLIITLCLIKGSVMSLMAGLVFGLLSAYGAFNVSNNPSDIKYSLREYTWACPDPYKMISCWVCWHIHVSYLFQLLLESFHLWWDRDTRNLEK